MRHRCGTSVRVLALTLLGALAVSGCAPETIEPTGAITTETREIGEVNAVDLRCPAKVTLVPNSDPGVTIRADKAAMRYLKTVESNGTLIISIEGGGQSIAVAPDVTIEVEVRASTFGGIRNTDSGSVGAQTLDTDHLQISSLGSGPVEIGRVTAIQITCEIAGSGNVSVDGGRVGAQDIRITGSGSYLAPDLESGVVTVTATGSGNVEVWATEGLDVTGNGSGHVSYWGEPRLTEEATASGKTKSLGPK